MGFAIRAAQRNFQTVITFFLGSPNERACRILPGWDGALFLKNLSWPLEFFEKPKILTHLNLALAPKIRGLELNRWQQNEGQINFNQNELVH